jgi:hypothetical protein
MAAAPRAIAVMTANEILRSIVFSRRGAMHRLRCTWDVSRAAIVHGIFLNGTSDVRGITQRASRGKKFLLVKVCLNVKTCPLFVPP